MAEIDELCEHPPPPLPTPPPPPEPPRIVRIESTWHAVACRPGTIVNFTAVFDDGTRVPGVMTTRLGETRITSAHGRTVVFLAHQPEGPGSCAAVMFY